MTGVRRPYGGGLGRERRTAPAYPSARWGGAGSRGLGRRARARHRSGRRSRARLARPGEREVAGGDSFPGRGRARRARPRTGTGARRGRRLRAALRHRLRHSRLVVRARGEGHGRRSVEHRRLVATGHSGKHAVSRVWNAGTGGLITAFVGHSGGITDVEFAPADPLLVTASADGTGGSTTSPSARRAQFIAHADRPHQRVLVSARVQPRRQADRDRERGQGLRRCGSSKGSTWHARRPQGHRYGRRA